MFFNVGENIASGCLPHGGLKLSDQWVQLNFMQ